MISLPAALIIFYFKEKDFYSLLYTVSFFCSEYKSDENIG